MSINKVVIPIAGLGTRFLPVTKVIPKEMLPINGKPIIHILVEEAANSGIEEVIFVINPEKKRIIKEYFSAKNKTNEKIFKKGKQESLHELDHLIKSVKIRYVVQREQLGDGHAIIQAKKYIGREPFAVMFGDDIVKTNGTPALAQLIEVFKKTGSSVIAIQEIDKSQSINYGVPKTNRTITENIFGITDLVEKPIPSKAPSNFGIIGKYIITEKAFNSLKKLKSGSLGEIRLIDGLKANLKEENLTELF